MLSALLHLIIYLFVHIFCNWSFAYLNVGLCLLRYTWCISESQNKLLITFFFYSCNWFGWRIHIWPMLALKICIVGSLSCFSNQRMYFILLGGSCWHDVTHTLLRFIHFWTMNVDCVIDLSQCVDATFNPVIDVQFSILFHWKNFIPLHSRWIKCGIYPDWGCWSVYFLINNALHKTSQLSAQRQNWTGYCWFIRWSAVESCVTMTFSDGAALFLKLMWMPLSYLWNIHSISNECCILVFT